jgi:hypothetical protein
MLTKLFHKKTIKKVVAGEIAGSRNWGIRQLDKLTGK